MIKNNLQFLIESNGLNVSQVAKDLKVSRSTIYRVLDGKPPSAELMLKLSDYFKKPVNDIFYATNVRHVVQKKGAAV
ncbi:helix-turn-helix transcriptional regulator [Paenibacillus alkalitolerans]|uniref:helix-turn-helix transcriptional regulator n=1 Tax=Paenibacillus alkalitolerans TaxID=2799335 RepID=UPI0018F6BDF2|nr:helix-turn-helix domain-containing protein [Paenibacillus alkalitolerans]